VSIPAFVASDAYVRTTRRHPGTWLGNSIGGAGLKMNVALCLLSMQPMYSAETETPMD